MIDPLPFFNLNPISLNMNTPIGRRNFLGTLTALGVASKSTPLFSKSSADFDEDLTVFLSDLHVNGAENGPIYQREKLSVLVAEVLRMNPLPAHAVLFGDLAWLWGDKKDYEFVAQLIKPLSDAGIKLTMAMGNHDRRSTFGEVFPEYAGATKIPGRVVSVTDLGKADLIMLDGLQGSDDRKIGDSGPVPGVLCQDQQDWLLDVLPKWEKPVFVCSHFPIDELTVGDKPLKKLLLQSNQAAGYMHGHDHKWYKLECREGYTNANVKRSLCLPSTGHWGDIGYTTFRIHSDRAVATLHQKEYFFPKPDIGTEVEQRLWGHITAENQNQICTFPLPA